MSNKLQQAAWLWILPKRGVGLSASWGQASRPGQSPWPLPLSALFPDLQDP